MAAEKGTYRYILFDFDGVIAHKVDFAAEVERKYGLDVERMYQFFRMHLPACLRGEADIIALLEADLLSIHWHGSATELFHALYTETLSINQELLTFLHNKLTPHYTCYISTNQEEHRFGQIQSHPLIQTHFRAAFGSCQVGAAKPDPLYFKGMMSQLAPLHPGIQKNQVLFIDDLEENVISAKHFGFHAHLFTNLEAFERFLDT